MFSDCVCYLTLKYKNNVCIGAFGVDFTYHKGDGLDIVKKGLLQYGVTGFCPTIVSTTCSNYHEASIVLGYF